MLTTQITVHVTRGGNVRAHHQLVSEGFTPSQLQTNHSQCSEISLNHICIHLLLLIFPCLKPWIVFPNVKVHNLSFYLCISVISTFSSATFTSSVDFIKLLLPLLSASPPLICPGAQKVVVSSDPPVLNLLKVELFFPSRLFGFWSTRDPCAYIGRDGPELNGLAPPSPLLLLRRSVSEHGQLCQAAPPLPTPEVQQ